MAPSGSTHCQGRGRVGCRTCLDRGTGSTPTGYAIYRNGVKVGETANTAYTDTKLVRGTYTYTVQALYDGNHASTLSDTALVAIVKGEPYFAPTQLQANITLNKHVTLGWQQPDALLKQPVRRCTGLRRGRLLLCRCGIRCRRPCPLPRHDTRLGERLH